VGKIDFSNLAKLSGSGGIFAGAGFLPDLEKVADSVGALVLNDDCTRPWHIN